MPFAIGCTVAMASWATAAEFDLTPFHDASKRKAGAVADGIPQVRQRDAEAPLPDRADQSSDRVSVIDLESVAGRVPPFNDRVGLLTEQSSKPRSGCFGTAATPWTERKKGS